MLTIWAAVVRRELLLAFRRRTDVLNTLVFFAIVVSLFPLAVGGEMRQLAAIAPGVVWVAALLATLLSLHRLFGDDYGDGTLEQFALAAVPLSWIVGAKVCAYWLAVGLPLVIIGPILALQLGLGLQESLVLGAALLLGTPVLALLGAIGAALTLGLRGGGVLLALLVLPLEVPVLIFGAGAVSASESGLSAAAHLWLMAAALVLASFFAPWACAAALRIALE